MSALHRACVDRALLSPWREMERRPHSSLGYGQGVCLLRADLALVLRLPVDSITVEHMEGAGCYGP